MKKFVQKISASLSKGMFFGLGVLFSGAVLAAVAQLGLNAIDNQKVEGDTVTANEFNMIVTGLKGLRTGCTGGMVLKGLQDNGNPDCVAAGGGGAGGTLLEMPEGLRATVTASAGSPTVTIGLNWDAVLDATGYELMRLSSAGASGGTVTKDGTVQTVVSPSYSWGNLTKATHYFKVRATDGPSNKGLWSSVLVVTTTTVPNVATNINMQSINDGSARVTWNAPADTGGMTILAYEIKFTPTGNVFGLNESESWVSFIIPEAYASIPPGTSAVGQPATVVSVSGQTLDYISTGIPAGTYSVQVRAINAVGAGAWANGNSNVVISTPDLSAAYSTSAFLGAVGGEVGGAVPGDLSSAVHAFFPPWVGPNDPPPVFPGDLTDIDANGTGDALERGIPIWVPRINGNALYQDYPAQGFGN